MLYNVDGALAQLVARFNGIEEVTGSNPVRSTTYGKVFELIREPSFFTA